MAAMAMLLGGTTLLSVSIGIKVRVPQRDEKIEDFIDGADKALYRAKDNGRNRTEVAPMEPALTIVPLDGPPDARAGEIL